ncbi:hypothetical protein SNEBB_003940 [Seison nebaliae]|nr:hypothetical protein SNEBB_003940 [Seison nebaliae]
MSSSLDCCWRHKCHKDSLGKEQYYQFIIKGVGKRRKNRNGRKRFFSSCNTPANNIISKSLYHNDDNNKKKIDDERDIRDHEVKLKSVSSLFSSVPKFHHSKYLSDSDAISFLRMGEKMEKRKELSIKDFCYLNENEMIRESTTQSTNLAISILNEISPNNEKTIKGNYEEKNNIIDKIQHQNMKQHEIDNNNKKKNNNNKMDDNCRYDMMMMMRNNEKQNEEVNSHYLDDLRNHGSHESVNLQCDKICNAVHQSANLVSSAQPINEERLLNIIDNQVRNIRRRTHSLKCHLLRNNQFLISKNQISDEPFTLAKETTRSKLGEVNNRKEERSKSVDSPPEFLSSMKISTDTMNAYPLSIEKSSSLSKSIDSGSFIRFSPSTTTDSQTKSLTDPRLDDEDDNLDEDDGMMIDRTNLLRSQPMADQDYDKLISKENDSKIDDENNEMLSDIPIASTSSLTTSIDRVPSYSNIDEIYSICQQKYDEIENANQKDLLINQKIEGKLLKSTNVSIYAALNSYFRETNIPTIIKHTLLHHQQLLNGAVLHHRRICECLQVYNGHVYEILVNQAESSNNDERRQCAKLKRLWMKITKIVIDRSKRLNVNYETFKTLHSSLPDFGAKITSVLAEFEKWDVKKEVEFNKEIDKLIGDYNELRSLFHSMRAQETVISKRLFHIYDVFDHTLLQNEQLSNRNLSLLLHPMKHLEMTIDSDVSSSKFDFDENNFPTSSIIDTPITPIFSSDEDFPSVRTNVEAKDEMTNSKFNIFDNKLYLANGDFRSMSSSSVSSSARAPVKVASSSDSKINKSKSNISLSINSNSGVNHYKNLLREDDEKKTEKNQENYAINIINNSFEKCDEEELKNQKCLNNQVYVYTDSLMFDNHIDENDNKQFQSEDESTDEKNKENKLQIKTTKSNYDNTTSQQMSGNNEQYINVQSESTESEPFLQISSGTDKISMTTGTKKSISFSSMSSTLSTITLKDCYMNSTDSSENNRKELNELKVENEWQIEFEKDLPIYKNLKNNKNLTIHPKLKRLIDEDLNELNDIKFIAYRTAMKIRRVQLSLSFNSLRLRRINLIFSLFNLPSSMSRFVFYQSRLKWLSIFKILCELFAVESVRKERQITRNSFRPYHHRMTEKDIPENKEITRMLMITDLVFDIYDHKRSGYCKLFDLFIFLVIMCEENLEEKYQTINSIVTQPNTLEIGGKERVRTLLKSLLAIPIYLKSSTAFGYDTLMPTVHSCLLYTGKMFEEKSLVDWLKMEPQSIVWLSVMQRLMDAETQEHSVRCNECKAYPIRGFRYRSLKRFNHDICQQCFFSGNIGGVNSVKLIQEYSSPTSSLDNFRDFIKTIKYKFYTKKHFEKNLRFGYLPMDLSKYGDKSRTSHSLEAKPRSTIIQNSMALNLSSSKPKESSLKSGNCVQKLCYKQTGCISLKSRSINAEPPTLIQYTKENVNDVRRKDRIDDANRNGINKSKIVGEEECGKPEKPERVNSKKRIDDIHKIIEDLEEENRQLIREYDSQFLARQSKEIRNDSMIGMDKKESEGCFPTHNTDIKYLYANMLNNNDHQQQQKQQLQQQQQQQQQQPITSIHEQDNSIDILNQYPYRNENGKKNMGNSYLDSFHQHHPSQHEEQQEQQQKTSVKYQNNNNLIVNERKHPLEENRSNSFLNINSTYPDDVTMSRFSFTHSSPIPPNMIQQSNNNKTQKQQQQQHQNSSLCAAQPLLEKARELREHKDRLEERMHVLKNHNSQLEAQLTQLHQWLNRKASLERHTPTCDMSMNQKILHEILSNISNTNPSQIQTPNRHRKTKDPTTSMNRSVHSQIPISQNINRKSKQRNRLKADPSVLKFTTSTTQSIQNIANTSNSNSPLVNTISSLSSTSLSSVLSLASLSNSSSTISSSSSSNRRIRKKELLNQSQYIHRNRLGNKSPKVLKRTNLSKHSLNNNDNNNNNNFDISKIDKQLLMRILMNVMNERMKSTERKSTRRSSMSVANNGIKGGRTLSKNRSHISQLNIDRISKELKKELMNMKCQTMNSHDSFEMKQNNYTHHLSQHPPTVPSHCSEVENLFDMADEITRAMSSLVNGIQYDDRESNEKNMKSKSNNTKNSNNKKKKTKKNVNIGDRALLHSHENYMAHNRIEAQQQHDTFFISKTNSTASFDRSLQYPPKLASNEM